MRKISGGSQLLLVEKGVGLFSTVLRYGDGSEKQLPAVTPAKDLIAATEIDYQEYRREIKCLREEHPLVEDRLDISVADFEDFVAEALLLPSMLQKTDPVGFFGRASPPKFAGGGRWQRLILSERCCGTALYFGRSSSGADMSAEYF